MNSNGIMIANGFNSVGSAVGARRYHRDPQHPDNPWVVDPIEDVRCFAWDIDDNNNITGMVRTNSTTERAVVWDDQSVRHTLPTAGNYNVNHGMFFDGHGGVIGEIARSTNLDYGIAFWSDLSATPTVVSFGDKILNLKDRNSSGTIIGVRRRVNADVLSEYGWVWDPVTGGHDINDLLVSNPTQLNVDILSDVNDRGEILGYARGPNGYHTTVLLQPVPEPGSLAVLALGAVGLLKKRRKA